MKFLIFISVFASVSAFVVWFDLILKEEKVRARLGLVSNVKVPNGLIIGVTKPLWRPISACLAKIRLEPVRRYLNALFVSAGVDGIIQVEEFWGFQIVMAALFGFLGFMSGWLWLVVPGLVFPIVWLRGLAKKRKNEMVGAMPDILDILTLSVEAGLDFMAALSRVAAGGYKNPMIDEFRRMLDEVKIGATRSEALKNLSERCNLPSVSSFTALLIQADRLGASVGPVLRAQSEKMRADRFQRAERAGAAAAQKILFPLIFCIIPAVFIVIFGPVIVQFVTGGIKL